MGFADRVKALLQDFQPGLWQMQLIMVPCRTTVVVPHYHGRIPDFEDLIDINVLIMLILGGGGGGQFLSAGGQTLKTMLSTLTSPATKTVALEGGLKLEGGAAPEGGGELLGGPAPVPDDCIPLGDGFLSVGFLLVPFGGEGGGPGFPLPTTPIPDGVLRPEGKPVYEIVTITPAATLIRNWSLLPGFYVLLTMSRQGDMPPGETPDDLYLAGVYVDFMWGPGANPNELLAFDISTYTDQVKPTAWLWDMGDTNTYNTPNVDHTYANPGAYTVTMTVTFVIDGQTMTRTITKNVTV